MKLLQLNAVYVTSSQDPCVNTHVVILLAVTKIGVMEHQDYTSGCGPEAKLLIFNTNLDTLAQSKRLLCQARLTASV